MKDFILGTVQLGLPYGINNKKGMPLKEDAFNILNTAWDLGVRFLDTAEAYGEAENLIGEFHKKNPLKKFQILSKFKKDTKKISEHLSLSLNKLNIDKLYSYSFHSFSDLDPSTLRDLNDLKNEGVIKNIGISIYDNDEFLKSIETEEIDIIQIPFNLFDNYSKKEDLLKKAKKNNKKIHIRSIFLQGLFFKEDLTHFTTNVQKGVSYLNELAISHSTSMEDMAISYALSPVEIDAVLMGVDSKDQLIKNLNSFNKVKMSSELIKKINLIDVPSNDIDPRKW